MAKKIQAFDAYGRKIDYAIYEGDYTIEYEDDEEVGEPVVAFWRHDQYPYRHYGEVIRIDGEGYAYIKGISGYRFKCDVLIPMTKAQAAIAELEKLKQYRKEKMAQIEKEYATKLDEAVARHGLVK